MHKDIIRLICDSYGCSSTEAQEYQDDELRHLRELPDMDNFKEDDIGIAYGNLGLDLDHWEYFINLLTGT